MNTHSSHFARNRVRIGRWWLALTLTLTLALLPARIKPASKLPTLAARLKPDGTAAAKPSPPPAAQPASAPLPSAPQTPPPRAEPQYKPVPPAAPGTDRDDEFKDLFETMFSDGVGQ